MPAENGPGFVPFTDQLEYHAGVEVEIDRFLVSR
jgi:hypothetical protein